MPKSCDALQAEQIARLLPEDTDEAISVMSDVCDILEGRPPPLKRRLSRFPWVEAALVTGLFFFPGYEAVKSLVAVATATESPALIEQDGRFVQDHIKRGQDLLMEVIIKHTRPCIWTWTRDWRDVSGVIVARSQVPGSAVAVTADFVVHRVKLEVPGALSAGIYSFHAIGHASCGHEPDYTFVQKPLTFTLLD